MSQIIIRLSGQDNNDAPLCFEDFLKQLDAVRHAIRETERIITRSKTKTVEIRVVGLSRSSPATVELGISPHGKAVDNTVPLVNMLFENVQAIQYRREVPSALDGDAMRAYADMGTRIGKSISAMELQANGNTVTISEAMSRNAEAILSHKEYAFGSLSGRLERINVHNNQNVFFIYPIIGPAGGVKCTFGQAQRHKAVDAVACFVDVQGRLVYNAIDSFPEEIRVHEIDIREEPIVVPKLADLQGIVPDATGDSLSEESIGELMDEWG